MYGPSVFFIFIFRKNEIQSFWASYIKCKKSFFKEVQLTKSFLHCGEI